MTPNTLRALRASIKHWEENAAAETPEEVGATARECALCAKFIYGGCTDCPVFYETGNELCEGTPYIAAFDALEAWEATPTPEAEAAFRIAARAEVDFLKSLLPADAPKHLETDDTGDGR